MKMEKYNMTMFVPKNYTEKYCNYTEIEIEHTKKKPHCHNVTKLNCVTVWEIDSQGNKVGVSIWYLTIYYFCKCP